MEYKKLGDIATYINGYAFKPEQRGSEGLPIIRIQDLTGNAYDLGYYDGDYPKKIELNDGDVLISWSASLGVYLWNRGKALLNQHIFKVVFDKVEIDKFYFMYAVEYNLDKMSLKTHGATMKHITKKDFDNVVIPYPDLDYQKEVSYRLTSLKGVIEKYQEQLELLDELVKARFVEMFGDPVLNEKGWITKPLIDMGNCKNGMNFHYNENGCEVKCLGVGDFKDLSIINNIESLQTVSLNEMPSEEYMLRDNDIVFVRSNGNKALVGRSVVIYPGDVPTTFSGFCIRYRKYDDSIIVPYLLHVLKTDSFRNKMVGRGANIQNLNQQILASLIIPVPPLELQNQFASFVQEIDKSRLLSNYSLSLIKSITF